MWFLLEDFLSNTLLYLITLSQKALNVYYRTGNNVSHNKTAVFSADYCVRARART
jgi:hypothetical protein